MASGERRAELIYRNIEIGRRKMTEEGCGWPEVDVAVREARREVKLCGGEAARRVQASGGVLPPQLFALPLNLLTLTELQLERLPAELDRLKQLRSLLVFNTGLLEFPKGALRLPELSVLDLSRNQIPTVPELSCLSHLSTINMSGNQLEHFPSCLLPKLLLLDLSHNRLAQFPDVCRKENSHLADLKLNSNCIADIPAEVSCLPALKNLDLGLNQIKLVPKELSEIPRLKGNDMTRCICGGRISCVVRKITTVTIAQYSSISTFLYFVLGFLFYTTTIKS